MCIQYNSNSLTSSLYSEPLLTEALEMQARLPAAMCVYHMGFILQEVQMALPDQQDTLTHKNRESSLG